MSGEPVYLRTFSVMCRPPEHIDARPPARVVFSRRRAEQCKQRVTDEFVHEATSLCTAAVNLKQFVLKACMTSDRVVRPSW
jgi:hypothetical protein